MHATTPAKDMAICTTVSEDTVMCARKEGCHLFKCSQYAGAVPPSVHATTTSECQGPHISYCCLCSLRLCNGAGVGFRVESGAVALLQLDP